MADKSFNIDFMFNGLGDALGKQEQMNMNLQKQEATVKAINNEMISGLTERELHQSRITKHTSKQLSLSKEQEGAFGVLIKKTPLNLLFRGVEGMKEFNRAAGQFKGMNFGDVVGGQMKNAANTANLFSKNLHKIVGGGMKGMFKNLGGVVKILGASLQSLGASILAIGAPIAIIVAAVFTLKRMWENNVGDMQKYFFKMVGALKDVWGKFSVTFNQALRKLSPLFKILFAAVFMPLTNAIKTVGILLDGVFIVIDPILDALKGLGDALLSPFEAFNRVGGKGIDVMKALKTVILVPFKLAGAAIRYSLLPLTTMFKLVGKLSNLFANAAQKAGVFKVLQPIFDAFKDAISSIKEAFNELMEPFTELKLGGGDAFKILAAGIKIALFPLTLLAKGIAALITGISKLVVGFLKLKFVKGLFAGIVSAVEMMKSAVEALIAPFKFIIQGAEKVYNLLGKDKSTKEKAVAEASPVSTQQIIQNQMRNERNNVYNNNNNIAIHASGTLNEKSAPRIGDILASKIGFESRAL